MTQANFATTISDTGQMMNGAYLEPTSSFSVSEQPEVLAFFHDLGQVAPGLVQDATPADLLNLHRMGVACRLCGQFALAENFYSRALELAESSLGKDSPAAAPHRNFLAGLYFTWQRYPESVSLIETSLLAYQKTFGAEHIYTRLTHFALALAFAGMGDKVQSKHHYQLSSLNSQAHVEQQSQDRWSTFSARLASLAATKYEQGKFDEAVELFRHCVIHEANEAWPGSLVVARSLGALAVLCRSQNLENEAEEFYKMALQMKKDICGEAHPEYQTTLKQFQQFTESRARRWAN